MNRNLLDVSVAIMKITKKQMQYERPHEHFFIILQSGLLFFLPLCVVD